jgi:hypothetical protein
MVPIGKIPALLRLPALLWVIFTVPLHNLSVGFGIKPIPQRTTGNTNCPRSGSLASRPINQVLRLFGGRLQ